MYDLTPDRNFVVDTVPGYPQVGLCVGAGHAAKFAALLGHILADLAIDGETGYAIDAFTLDRPAITDPGFPRTSGWSAPPRSTAPMPGRLVHRDLAQRGGAPDTPAPRP